jgi:ABC-2 type transport system ATP-binding protein
LKAAPKNEKEMLRLVNVRKIYRVRERGFLRPRYRLVKALDGVSLEVGRGEVLGVLGPNGAGKSTLCKIAAGMVKPTSGQALLDGVDITQNIRHVSRSIGVVLGPTLLYYRLTGYRYLKFFAKIYGVSQPEQRIHDLAKTLGLERWLNTYIESYSLGMKMKISLARALLHDPPLLILDEFTMGLDPKAASEVREYVKSSGKTILLTTHNTLEAESLCDRIALLSAGRLVAVDTLGNLLREVEDRVKLVATIKKSPHRSQQDSEKASSLADRRDRVEMVVETHRLPEALRALVSQGFVDVETKRCGLEDVYLKLCGKPLTD